MRIALLTDGIYPYFIGGMQKHSYYLAKYFAINKISVDLYHCLNDENKINFDDIFSEQEKKYIRHIIIEVPVFRNLPGHYIRESYAYSQNILKSLKENLSVDFIYAQGFTAWDLLQKKNKGFKCPAVGINLHGLEMFQPAFSIKSRIQNRFLQRPAKYILQNADYIFSFGGKITDLVYQLGIEKSKIIELPNGVEMNLLNTKAESKNRVRRFVFVGRYERRKGIEELHNVLDKLKDSYNLEFDFIGSIPDHIQIQSSKIKYNGSIKDSEKVYKILQSCDCLVCPSIAEGMPTVILEGMAKGLAIIATEVGAVNNMVSPMNGWLIPPNNKIQLLKAFTEAITISDEDLLKLKWNSLKIVQEKFIWESIIGQLITEISSRIQL